MAAPASRAVIIADRSCGGIHDEGRDVRRVSMYHDARAGSHPSVNADVIRGHVSDPTRGRVRAGGRQANRQTTDSPGKSRHDAMTFATDAHHHHRFLIGQWGDEGDAHGASALPRVPAERSAESSVEGSAEDRAERGDRTVGD